MFFTWNFFKKSLLPKSFIINFGPQHPAAHGVLRLILQLEGEIIQKTDVHIGLLHRGTEFLSTTKFYEKNIPYFDRLDYVSMMSQEHAYCLTIEQLLNISNNGLSTNYIRILFDEITRLLNHFLAIACHALDIGSMSSIFWAFEEREKLMEFYERVSGARMHAAFHRPSFLFNFEYSYIFLIDILHFITNCFTTLNEMHNVLTYNKIWKQRLVNIGLISKTNAEVYGLTGVLLRSTGVKRDLRLSSNESYSSYNTLYFKSFIGVNGDSYDRFLIRMLEMGESLTIINTLLVFLLKKYKQTSSSMFLSSILSSKKLSNTNYNSYSSMENLIDHFINWHTGIVVPKNISNFYIESPKGEFGVNILSNNSSYPFKCKIRSPSYHNLQMLPKLSKGHYLADLAALIGTIDIVFGEIDR